MTASESLDRQLESFRRSHEAIDLAVGQQRWRYVIAGNRDTPPLLLLGGALGRAEFAFQQVGLLSRDCFVIAPDYPPVASLTELTDGLVALLDRERVQRAHVVGGSFGGFIAQALVARTPDRVASLVLSHTGAPDGRRHAVGWISFFPGWLLRWLMSVRLKRTLREADPFWRKHFAHVVASLSQADIASRVRLQAEFGAMSPMSPDFQGPVLLMSASDDPLLRPAAQSVLAARFPGAEHHEFIGTGHTVALLQPETYAERILAFIRRHAMV